MGREESPLSDSQLLLRERNGAARRNEGLRRGLDEGASQPPTANSGVRPPPSATTILSHQETILYAPSITISIPRSLVDCFRSAMSGRYSSELYQALRDSMSG